MLLQYLIEYGEQGNMYLPVPMAVWGGARKWLELGGEDFRHFFSFSHLESMETSLPATGASWCMCPGGHLVHLGQSTPVSCRRQTVNGQDRAQTDRQSICVSCEPLTAEQRLLDIERGKQICIGKAA
jgi:hypothetical protein